MGCVSSKILSKSGSFQEKVVSHGFKRSNLIEENILSNPKSNGDQFLALHRTSNAGKDAADQSTTAAAGGAEQLVKIETINVSDLLAGLEEEEEEEEECNGGEKSAAQPCVSDAVAGRARSFRTVEKFNALVTQCSSPEQSTPAKQSDSSEQEEEARAAAATVFSADIDATGGKQSKQSEQEEVATATVGNKRRARARQLDELKVPPAFDFSKSGSLRDWLLQGGQIFSPGSYVTPNFGNSAAPPPRERGVHHAGEPRLQPQPHSMFDPELVEQFEQAMERLSKDEERALEKILEAMGAAAAEEVKRR